MGEVVESGPFAGFEIVYAYTRQQAIEDGVLVDLSSGFPNETRMFKWNVCCTSAVWEIIERAAEADGTEIAVYVWDVCYMACQTVRIVRLSSGEVFFKVCLPLQDSGKHRKLKIVCGPISYDDPTPCLTIMLPDED